MAIFSEKDRQMISDIHKYALNEYCEFHNKLVSEIDRKLILDQGECIACEIRMRLYISVYGTMISQCALYGSSEVDKNHSIRILREIYDRAVDTINHKYENDQNERNPKKCN